MQHSRSAASIRPRLRSWLHVALQHCSQSWIFINSSTPQLSNSFAGQQEMGREDVDQALHIITAAQRDLRRIGVTEEMMAKLMREVKAAAPRIYVAVYQGDAHILNFDVSGIASCLANVQGEREETNILASAPQVV